ncbi:MAG: formylmethanofuran dehydrogenase subunit B [Candidatus Hodarchaeales archaeon]|jgi:formylmethanofuran dehydrogenase subunit B
MVANLEPPEGKPDRVKTITSVACPFCGSLCDDLEIDVTNGNIIAMRNGCRISNEKFMYAQKKRIIQPLLKDNGKHTPISMEKAIEKLTELLLNAKRPLIYGWSTTSVEAIKSGIHVAELTGAVIDNTSCVCHGPSVLGVHGVGLPGSSLGEVKNRADLIIYWGANPIHAHPRHSSRYSVFARGAFRQHGREQRKVIVVDPRKTETAVMGDLHLQPEPNGDYELMAVIRAMLKGFEIEQEQVSGVPMEDIKKLLAACKEANFVMIYFGLGLTMSAGKHRNIDIAVSLVRDLNTVTKAVISPMRGHFNVTGFNRIALWETGFPFAIDYARGYPSYYPGETSSVDMLAAGEPDLAVIVGSDPVSHFPLESAKFLAKIPSVALNPHHTPMTEIATLVIPTTMTGVDSDGTAYRMDGVPIMTRSVVPPPDGVLMDKQIFDRVIEKILEGQS